MSTHNIYFSGEKPMFWVLILGEAILMSIYNMFLWRNTEK